MRKKLAIVVLIICFVVTPMMANATSIMPSLSNYPVAGEAEFNAFFPLNRIDQAYVDWIVFAPGSYGESYFEDLIYGISGDYSLDDYLYLYQIEARGTPALTDIENLTIYFDTSLITLAGAYYADLDLWHNAGYFANLATEGENLSAAIEPLHFGPAWFGDNITWDYDGGLDAGEESDICWFISPYPAIYAPAAINNTAQTGGYVPAPAPIPEPTSLFLLGGSLLGLAAFARNKRKR